MNIMSQIGWKDINLSVYDQMYNKKELTDRGSKYIMECPIHGDFIIPAFYATQHQEFFVCPSCVSFSEHLTLLYGKEAAFEVLKVIYRVSWDNRAFINKVKKAIPSAEDKCHMIYKILKEKVTSFVEPPLLSQKVAELENISGDDIVFNEVTNSVSVVETEKEACEKDITLEDFKSKLDKLTSGSVKFLDLEKGPFKALTRLMAVCPIHDEVYHTSLADLHAHKIRCPSCKPYYTKLVQKYKAKQSFELVIGVYREFIKYKNDPKTILSLSAVKMLDEVKPDHQTFKTSEAKEPLHLGTLNVNKQEVVATDKSCDVQPVKHSNKKGKVGDLVTFLKNLTVDDIRSIRVEVDIELDAEMTIITLKTGKVITLNN
jgi:hypothetical protein